MDTSMSKLLNKLVEEQDGGKVSAGKIIARFEDRGFGPLLLIPSLPLSKMMKPGMGSYLLSAG